MKQYAPPFEKLHCVLVRNKQWSFLMYGMKSEELVNEQFRIVGPITYVCYGLNNLKVQDTVFPVRVIGDYGSVYSGMSAIDWIIKKGLAHPRADVDGVRSDGTITTCMLRELDLSVAPTVYVGADSTDFPDKRVDGIVTLDGAIAHNIFSKRVRHCLPIVFISDDVSRSTTNQI
jgi:hypothetical protein